jgi:DNA-binding SARP family transcriptional activator/streptogramin lyase
VRPLTDEARRRRPRTGHGAVIAGIGAVSDNPWQASYGWRQVVEFRILGPLELVEDGRPVELAGGRQRTLLALLLLRANEVVSTDRLIDGLWGDRPPATAAKVLQNAVSQLRRSLGDNLILTRAPGYLLRVEPDAIDARRFEALLEDGRRTLAEGDAAEAAQTLREGLGMWRGPPLDKFAYEPFAAAEAARLDELRMRALEERIEADLALGRHADLVGELERFVAEHPLRERPRGQLMLALYRSGRQAEALRAYEEGRRHLAEELGLEPGAALQQLEKQILTRDPALEPPGVREPSEQRRRAATTATTPKRPHRRLALGLAAIALIATTLVAAFLLTGGDDAAPTVVPNSVVKIDPKTGEIVDVFRVGGNPFKPAIVGDYVFVSSEEDGILSRIDLRSGEVDTFGGLPSPAGVAAGADGTIWVGSFESNEIRRLDADDYGLVDVIEIPPRTGPWYIVVGGGSVWASQNDPPAVSRFSARTGELQRRHLHHVQGAGAFSTEVAFGEGAAWTGANGLGRSELLRIDALGGGSEAIEIGGIPYAVTVGLGAVWMTDLVDVPVASFEPEAGRVLRIDPTTGELADLIPVGKRPVGVTTGAGSVWVANGGEKTISEIDPRTNEVVSTIPMQYYPHNVAYGHGFLWATLHAEPFTF